MHRFNIENTSQQHCSCCSSSNTTSRRKRSRPCSILVTALALFAVTSSTSAFQPSVVVTSASTPSRLYASTVAPPRDNHHHKNSLWNTDPPLFPNNNEKRFHWPWEQSSSSSTKQIATTTTTPQDVWVQKYCTVDGLRQAFGRNQNVLWGDLDATNTRRLYKTLMPVALMDLYKSADVQPQDLAPLAYKARVAAKLYARERCQVPARIAANLFDGYRQWRKYGSFDCTGMSYQQVWEKYANMVQSETEETDADHVTEQVCLKILEKSCQSNAMIDEMVLTNKNKKSEWKHLKQVQDQLEKDVRLLLLPSDSTTVELHHDNIRHWSARQAQKFRALRAFAKFKRRMAALQHHVHSSSSNHHNSATEDKKQD